MMLTINGVYVCVCIGNCRICWNICYADLQTLQEWQTGNVQLSASYIVAQQDSAVVIQDVRMSAN